MKAQRVWRRWFALFLVFQLVLPQIIWADTSAGDPLQATPVVSEEEEIGTTPTEVPPTPDSSVPDTISRDPLIKPTLPADDAGLLPAGDSTPTPDASPESRKLTPTNMQIQAVENVTISLNLLSCDINADSPPLMQFLGLQFQSMDVSEVLLLDQFNDPALRDLLVANCDESADWAPVFVIYDDAGTEVIQFTGAEGFGSVEVTLETGRYYKIVIDGQEAFAQEFFVDQGTTTITGLAAQVTVEDVTSYAPVFISGWLCADGVYSPPETWSLDDPWVAGNPGNCLWTSLPYIEVVDRGGNVVPADVVYTETGAALVLLPPGGEYQLRTASGTLSAPFTPVLPGPDNPPVNWHLKINRDLLVPTFFLQKTVCIDDQASESGTVWNPDSMSGRCRPAAAGEYTFELQWKDEYGTGNWITVDGPRPTDAFGNVEFRTFIYGTFRIVEVETGAPSDDIEREHSAGPVVMRVVNIHPGQTGTNAVQIGKAICYDGPGATEFFGPVPVESHSYNLSSVAARAEDDAPCDNYAVADSAEYTWRLDLIENGEVVETWGPAKTRAFYGLPDGMYVLTEMETGDSSAPFTLPLPPNDSNEVIGSVILGVFNHADTETPGGTINVQKLACDFESFSGSPVEWRIGGRVDDVPQNSRMATPPCAPVGEGEYTFELWTRSAIGNKLVGEASTNSFGVASFTNVPRGDYYIVETATQAISPVFHHLGVECAGDGTSPGDCWAQTLSVTVTNYLIPEQMISVLKAICRADEPSTAWYIRTEFGAEIEPNCQLASSGSYSFELQFETADGVWETVDGPTPINSSGNVIFSRDLQFGRYRLIELETGEISPVFTLSVTDSGRSFLWGLSTTLLASLAKTRSRSKS